MSLLSDFPTIMFLLLMPLQCFSEYFQLRRGIKIIEHVVSSNLTVNLLTLIEIITLADNLFDRLVKFTLWANPQKCKRALKSGFKVFKSVDFI